MKNGWWLAGVGVVTTALIIIGCMIIFMSDRTAPEIAVQDIGITYTKGDKDKVLLQGVTAKDNKDGDVTDSLIVEGIVISKNGKQAKVCYVAKDKSNNITRAYRVVNYVSEGGASADGDAINNGGNTSAGGNSTEKETSGQSGNQKPTQTPTKAPTQAPAQNQTQSQTAIANGEKPVLVLKVTETTLKVGQTFNVVSYVADIADDKDARVELFKRIIADGKCDTSKPGDYTMTVYCSDSDMNYSDKKTLVVHVVQ